jgi:membrane protein implicated in regulation of membrane protease activity
MKTFSSKTVWFDTPSLVTVDRAIAPAQLGRVKFQSSFWNARFQDAGCRVRVEAGAWVWVVGRQGTQLLVEPVREVSKAQVCA